MEYKWSVITVTTIGTLMAGIDSRIVVIGLPEIARQLHAGAVEVVWITQAYLLASAVFLLFVGRVTDMFGKVKLYNLGFVIFTIGSALAALSANTSFLISSRVVQGVGAGILTANSAAIVTDASPSNQLGLMLGINNTAVRVGAMMGLTLSGVILSFTNWRGLFYVNLPIGIIGIIWAHRQLREISTKDRTKKVDWYGAILFSTGLTLLLLGITYLSYGLASYSNGAMFLISGISFLIVFTWFESKTTGPMLDLKLFKIALFSAGNLAQLLNVLAWSGMLLLLSFYLQIGNGYSALQAGLDVVPLEGAFLIVSLLAGRLSDKYGTRTLTTLGISINIFAFFQISNFTSSTSGYQVVLSLMAIGIGNGLFASPNQRAIMGSVPPDRRGVASAFRQTMNNIGWTISYGLVILFLTFGIPYVNLSRLLEGVNQFPNSLATKEFIGGFHIAALLLMFIEAAAILPSVLRGSADVNSSDEEIGLS